jgi:quercetin dioxygenase-like cupin family protein
MAFIDYNAKPKLKIWDGIYGQVQHSDHMTHAHISIAAGVELPEHHHVHEQWSHLLEGEIEFIVGGEKRHMKPGETAYIPSHVPHSGRTITDCKLIDVFSPVREDWMELEKKQFGK